MSNVIWIIYCAAITQDPGGFSSAGRAPALQAGGRRFDPVILHQKFKRKSAGFWLRFRFDLLEIKAVSFFNNLEEVKFYVNQRQLVGRVALNVSTNKATTLYFLSL